MTIYRFNRKFKLSENESRILTDEKAFMEMYIGTSTACILVKSFKDFRIAVEECFQTMQCLKIGVAEIMGQLNKFKEVEVFNSNDISQRNYVNKLLLMEFVEKIIRRRGSLPLPVMHSAGISTVNHVLSDRNLSGVVWGSKKHFLRNKPE